jgi:hypothetical protein
MLSLETAKTFLQHEPHITLSLIQLLQMAARCYLKKEPAAVAATIKHQQTNVHLCIECSSFVQSYEHRENSNFWWLLYQIHLNLFWGLYSAAANDTLHPKSWH